jgi:hypothetical protein
MKFAILLVCLAHVGFGQFRDHPHGPNRAGRYEYGECIQLFSFPSFAFTNYNNFRLNQWISENGAKAPDQLILVDLFSFSLLHSNGFNTGMSFSMMFPTNGSQSSSCALDFMVGVRFFRNDVFQSHLNGHIIITSNSIRGVVPPSISTPNDRDYLRNYGLGFGPSLANYVTLYKGRQRGHPFDLLFGIEGGITVTAWAPWEFGHSRSGGRWFSGLNVPEVPGFDTYFTYLKFSLNFKI